MLPEIPDERADNAAWTDFIKIYEQCSSFDQEELSNGMTEGQPGRFLYIRTKVPDEHASDADWSRFISSFDKMTIPEQVDLGRNMTPAQRDRLKYSVRLLENHCLKQDEDHEKMKDTRQHIRITFAIAVFFGIVWFFRLLIILNN